MMTRRERQHLAGALSTAAADMLARRYDTEDPEELERYREASALVARWLSRLPGYEWDVRLPDPEEAMMKLGKIA